MDKAGDFVAALLLYAMRCIEDGETETLHRMGFGPAEVEELATLRLADVNRIERLKSHLDIKVDGEAFAKMIRLIRTERLAAEWERELIRADAPFEMLRRLFGTSNREYVKFRRFYGLGSSVGRPREPTEAEQRRLWRKLATRIEHADGDVLSPAEYMAISRECGMPLRIVWRQSQRIVNGTG